MLESLFNKVGGPEALRLYYEVTPTKVFSCEICKMFENTFFYRTPPVVASVQRSSADTLEELLKAEVHISFIKNVLKNFTGKRKSNRIF